jgi:hypothetical protein
VCHEIQSSLGVTREVMSVTLTWVYFCRCP